MTLNPALSAVSSRSTRGNPFNVAFADLYLQLLSPRGPGGNRLQKLGIAAATPDAAPGGDGALEQCLSQLLGREVRLSEPQRHAFKRLAELPELATLSPWSGQVRHEEVREMVSASSLYDIYLALLKPDGGLMKRFKAVQAAAALYEPGTPGSGDTLEQELSRLIGRPVRLSEPQLRCFKELLVDEPAFAHIAPWEDLTASW
ncbi:hypothetical protein CYFUS_003395 [Cystobacter fuscus]|uniref:Uncharacterized protein n=1 Tax=Cystobacter fuscus TaxID=43 RepID=A0A250J1V2_9BACT|nr:hypothetical protein [Cystobacter fuscus]ATB37969.1 hypothetical protein CYFUS_003395 [Cystobacter fuscus]